MEGKRRNVKIGKGKRKGKRTEKNVRIAARKAKAFLPFSILKL